MTYTERLKKLQSLHPAPWSIVCRFVNGDYTPNKIVDNNGDKVLDTNWGAGTEPGQLTYAIIVELINNTQCKDYDDWADV